MWIKVCQPGLRNMVKVKKELPCRSVKRAIPEQKCSGNACYEVDNGKEPYCGACNIEHRMSKNDYRKHEM